MSSAVVRRQEKPGKIDQVRTGKAKVLKFDRHAGVVVVEKSEPPPKPRSIIVLVRDLLGALRRSVRLSDR